MSNYRRPVSSEQSSRSPLIRLWRCFNLQNLPWWWFFFFGRVWNSQIISFWNTHFIYLFLNQWSRWWRGLWRESGISRDAGRSACALGHTRGHGSPLWVPYIYKLLFLLHTTPCMCWHFLFCFTHFSLGRCIMHIKEAAWTSYKQRGCRWYIYLNIQVWNCYRKC